MEYWDGLLKTPYYLVDETLLKQNLEILREVSGRAGCKILLAQKAFSMFSVYPLLREYLAGSAASGLFEARLGHEDVYKRQATDSRWTARYPSCLQIQRSRRTECRCFRPSLYQAD